MARSIFDKNELSEVLSQYRRSIRSVGAFSAVINILALVPSLYMMQVYDRVMTSQNSTTLAVLTLVTLGLLLVSALLDASRTFVLVRIGVRFDSVVNLRIFTAAMDHYLKSGQQLASQSMRDLTTMRQFLTGPGLIALFDVPWLPIYLAVLYMFDFWMGVLATVGAAVSLLLTWINDKSSSGPLKEASDLASKSGRVADENVRNAEVIEAMGMLGSFTRRWRADHLKFLALQAIASDKAGLWGSFSKNFRVFLQSAALGLGAYLALKQEITPGMMIAGSILMGKALGPLDQLIATYKQSSAAKISYFRLLELLEQSPAKTRGLPLPAPKGDLSFESVSVGPPALDQPILTNATFRIPAGSIVGLVGPSGAGKSTLARAMIGVWKPKSGTVRIDGADLHTWDRERLGPHLGYLPQDVELFEGTVAENICRFATDIKPEDIISAAQQAGVHELILRLPKGYDTPLGPQGVGLSGGQRQRIGLARALFGNPVLIVLDEPNASLDDAGIHALNSAILGASQRGATVVLVTHRTDLLKMTHQIMVIQAGQITKHGPTAKVLESLQVRPAGGNQNAA